MIHTNYIQSTFINFNMPTFTSNKFTPKIKAKDELDKIDKNLNALTNSQIKTTNSKQNGDNLVYFKADNSDKLMSVELKTDNINKLKSVFGNDVYQGKNGIILTGKAEAYIAGWFDAVANKYNYANSDKDKDGILNEDEFLGVKGYILEKLEYSRSITGERIERVASVEFVDKKLDKKMPKEAWQNIAKSIKEALNSLVFLDKDSDGVLTYAEHLGETSKKVNGNNLIAHQIYLDMQDFKDKMGDMILSKSDIEMKEKIIDIEQKKEKKRLDELKKFQARLIKDKQNIDIFV